MMELERGSQEMKTAQTTHIGHFHTRQFQLIEYNESIRSWRISPLYPHAAWQFTALCYCDVLWVHSVCSSCSTIVTNQKRNDLHPNILSDISFHNT